MRWRGRRRSENVEDRGTTRAPVGKKGLAVGGGLGSIVLVLVIVLMGGDPAMLGNFLGEGQAPTSGAPGDVRANSVEEDEMLAFVSVVLADTEDVWNRLFADDGKRYPEPTLVRFRDAVQSACGTQSSAIGPFYCPADQQIYIDLEFFDALAKRHKAAGDFAQAYVIAHEVGHHVQTALGYSEFVRGKKRGLSETDANKWSVRQELHADFLAGVWAHHAQDEKNILERGDLEEAINAAQQIGDDTLQRRAQGYVVPDGFTHGTAKQRQRWFRMGFDTGDLEVGEDVYTMPYAEL